MPKPFEKSADLEAISAKLMEIVNLGDPDMTIKAAAERRQLEKFLLDVHKANAAFERAGKGEAKPSGDTEGTGEEKHPFHNLRLVGNVGRPAG